MALKIYLLGQFKLLVGERQVELPSRPAQSLLAYLLLNVGVTQRRERLASLLWPEANESNARGYLRQALWQVRKALGREGLNCEDYLRVSNISITFDPRSDYWLDADQILGAEGKQALEEMVEEVRFYRGELLPGFYEEWVVQERERLCAAYQQKMGVLLERLLELGEWEQALQWGEHWIRFGYSPEAAFQALMRAHAGKGDRGMVTTTYQRCEQALARELAVEPSLETRRLFERISQGRVDQARGVTQRRADVGAGHPRFLDGVEGGQVEKPIFVARERELAQLEEHLKQARSGRGRVVFITGEAGSGKTSLIQEFNEQALATHADLVVASGNCNAYTGIGDPYLPFREILELLTGDVEARWAAGAMTRQHARRLWKLLPYSAQALVEVGPDLLDTFVSSAALLERMRSYSPGQLELATRLDEYSRRGVTGSGLHTPQQSDLFEQYARVLKTLAHQKALVLVVDDLQWADLGSISLLFHLGRQLPASRILILGAYRAEEISIGREGERHPLEAVVNQSRRDYGEIIVNLDKAESREFVEALLDSEPNELRRPFRDMLHRQTRGHPLFTIELLRGLQERGDLVKDSDGYWVEGVELDWETLPARVEAVIEERIARLDDPLQAVLRVVCVEGEVFTAEVVARVGGIDDSEILGLLSGELDRRHRLVRAQSIQRLGGERLSYYRFRNILFQRYLYSSLDDVERVHLHERVGNVLEEIYGLHDQVEVIAVQLALHFQKAGITDKAIYYLNKAHEKALQLSAYQEAIAHLDKGVKLVMTLPDTPERAEQEIKMQLSLGNAWMYTATPAPEIEEAYTRARELCQLLGKTSQSSQVVGGLALFYYVRAEHRTAHEFALESLSLAEQIGDPLRVVLGHFYLGVILFCMGEFSTALSHLKYVIMFHDREAHPQSQLGMYAADPGLSALAYSACSLWCLGYPEQALQRSQEALKLARELGHPFTIADVLAFAGCLFNKMRRDGEAVLKYAEELMQLASEQNFLGWFGQGSRFRGDALAMLGQYQEGLEQIRQGMVTCRTESVHIDLTRALCSQAEAQMGAGQPEQGLATLDEALKILEQTNERYNEAELYRLRGEMQLSLGDEGNAEASFEKSVEVAHSQRAISWELRAATGLARLLDAQGRKRQAGQLLEEIYSCFTEGFDTPDLSEARALLDEIAYTR